MKTVYLLALVALLAASATMPTGAAASERIPQCPELPQREPGQQIPENPDCPEPVNYFTVATGVDAGQGSVSDNHGQIACPGDCLGRYVDGDFVLLTPNPAPGWRFAGWSDCPDGATAPTCSFGSGGSARATFADAQPPAGVSLSGLEPGRRYRGAHQLSASATDNVGVSSFEWLVDGTPVHTGPTFPLDTAAYPTGRAISIQVRARDAQGNAADSAPIAIIADNATAAAVVESTAPEGGYTNAPVVTAAYAVEDDVASIACKRYRNGAEVDAPCTRSGNKVTDAAADATDGTIGFKVVVTDQAGNTADSGIRTFTIDRQPPTASFTNASPDEDATVEPGTALRFALNVNGTGSPVAQVTCRVDDRPASPCDPQGKTFSDLEPGRREIEWEVRDAAGNARAVSRSVVVTGAGGSGAVALKEGQLGKDGPRLDDEGAPLPQGTQAVVNNKPISIRFGRVTTKIRHFWRVYSDRTTDVTKLNITGIAKGVKVEVRCFAGGRCPFRQVRPTVHRRNASLRPLFRGRRLNAGTTIEVRLTKAGAIGKVVRYTMRKDRLPTRQLLCLAPGATRPVACTGPALAARYGGSSRLAG